MQPPESVALSATSLELLSQLIISSQSVIAEDYSDAPDDQKDWMRLVCASLATILLTQDGNAQASTLVQTILGNDAFFRGALELVQEGGNEDEEEEEREESSAHKNAMVLALAHFCLSS